MVRPQDNPKTKSRRQWLPPSWLSSPASGRDWTIATRQIHCTRWKKLLEIPWLVKTCCFHCSRCHPSCSLAFEMHRLSRPFPSTALSLPLSSGVPLRWGGVTGSRRLAGWAVSTGFHVLSRVCEGLRWNSWRLQDAVWGRSRSDLLPRCIITMNSMFFNFMPFSLHFLPLCASAFCLHMRLVALFSIRPVHTALTSFMLVCRHHKCSYLPECQPHRPLSV